LPPHKRLLHLVGAAILNGLRSILFDPRRMRITSALLFALTAASCYLTGGVRLMAAVLAILVAHEMGHFLACRYHGVPSTWPFLLPAPVLNPLTGTLGALMVIQGRFPSRRALFDIGIAGPLAGLAVCLPVLLLGLLEATVLPGTAAASAGDTLGEPLLLTWATPLVLPHLPANPVIMAGPLLVAAWFGLLLTGLNLIPIGQFDGGHVLYALFPRHAHRLARVAWYVCLALVVLAPSWLFWAILTHYLGRPHPPTLDDGQPLGIGRRVLGLAALAAFVLTFIPEPLLNSWETLLGDVRYLLP
jgi:membrane-associated protease RseP (regulator of RpoE activity)